MSRDTKINLILFVIIIFLSLIAWYQPGLQKTVIKTLSTLKADDINNIIIERQGIGQIKLTKQKDQWFLQEPYQLAANPLRVNTLTALAEKRSYSSFEAKEEELSRYQLNKPLVTVWLNGKQFMIGSEDPINQQRYAINMAENHSNGTHTIHLINGTVFYQLRAALDTFISLQLIPSNHSLQSITWNNQTLSFKEGQWQLATDKTGISADSVAQLLQFWQQAQASRVETNVSIQLTNAELIKSKTIQITLKDSDSNIYTIDYLIIQEAEQIKLLRSDLQIAYWVTPQTLKLLTEFIPVSKKRE